jgi:hypothetical protein
VFPPEGQPGFYPESWNPQHIHIAVQMVENGAPEPYENMDWCQWVFFSLAIICVQRDQQYCRS